MVRFVSSASRYEDVPPPSPNTVARPTTLGACQVRLQLSTLLLPMTARANFCDRKFNSLVVFEQLKSPKLRGPCFATADRKPSAARSSASSQLAGRSTPPSRTRGCVSLAPRFFGIVTVSPKHHYSIGAAGISRGARRSGPRPAGGALHQRRGELHGAVRRLRRLDLAVEQADQLAADRFDVDPHGRQRRDPGGAHIPRREDETG